MQKEAKKACFRRFKWHILGALGLMAWGEIIYSGMKRVSGPVFGFSGPERAGAKLHCIGYNRLSSRVFEFTSRKRWNWVKAEG